MAAAAAAAAAVARCEAELAADDYAHVRDVDTDGLGAVPLSRRRGGGTWRVDARLRGADCGMVSELLDIVLREARDHDSVIEHTVVEEGVADDSVEVAPTLATLEEDTQIVRDLVDMPWPLEPREWVYVQTCRLTDGVLRLCLASTEHVACPRPPDDADVVRGVLWAAVDVRPCRGGLRAVGMSSFDFGGSVLAATVDGFADLMAKFLAMMQRELIGAGRRFRVVTANGVALRLSPAGADRASRRDAKEYGQPIPGGYGLPAGAEVEAEELDGTWPHDHWPVFVKFRVKRLLAGDRSFWVPTASEAGKVLLAPVWE